MRSCSGRTRELDAWYELRVGDGSLYNRLDARCWHESLRQRHLPQLGNLPVLEWYLSKVGGCNSDSALEIARLVP
jgi:hypothetical protein